MLSKTIKCKFHDTGYCKFRDHCRKRHFSDFCLLSNCKENCKARHPRLCRMENKCKFFKKGVCAYKHVTLANDDGIKKENQHLKEKIRELERLVSEEKIKVKNLLSEMETLEEALNVKSFFFFNPSL